MLKQEKTAETNKLINKMKRVFTIIVAGYIGGDYDKALKYIERSEEIIKRFQGDVPEEIKGIHLLCLWTRAYIHAYRGNLAYSFKDANELLSVGQFYDHKRGISLGTSALGNYYLHSGDLDTALVHYDRAIKVSEENLNDLMDFIVLADQLDLATRISIHMEDLKRAKKYFKRLEEIKELKQGNILINDTYRLAKAYLLKSSMGFRDRGMAEDLFRGLIEADHDPLMRRLRAISGLCELLLAELKVSNDSNIIDEIKPLLEKLISMAQPSGLYYFLIEAYIVHGKLALVMFDMESSRRYFTQAQYMAEKYGYIGLAKEIAELHNAMLEKKDTWEQMERNNALLSKRMELARLDDHLNGKFRMRMMNLERADDAHPKKEVF